MTDIFRPGCPPPATMNAARYAADFASPHGNTHAMAGIASVARVWHCVG